MSVIISGLYGTLHLTKSTYLINTAHFLKMTRAGQAVLATAASSAGWYRSSNVCAGPAPYHDPRSRTGTMRMAIAVSACSIQHADYASARCTYLAGAVDSARLQVKRILPVRVPGRSDL